MPSLNPQKLAELPIEKQLVVLAGLVILLVPGYVSFGYSVAVTMKVILTSGCFLVFNMLICSYYLHISKNCISRQLNRWKARAYQEHMLYTNDKLLHGDIDNLAYKKEMKNYEKTLDRLWADGYNGIYRSVNKDFQENTYYKGGLIFTAVALAGHYFSWWAQGARGAVLAVIIAVGLTLTLLCLRLTRRAYTFVRKLLVFVAYIPFCAVLLIVFYACATSIP